MTTRERIADALWLLYVGLLVLAAFYSFADFVLTLVGR